MRRVLKYCFLVFAVQLSINLAFAQEPDSLIQLYPGMDDTISYIDRTYFGLDNQIDGFEYSSVYIRNNKNLISKITFSENGILRDTILINDLSALENTRLKMKETENEFEKKIESLREVNVTAKDRRNFNGVLEGLSKSHLYLYTEKNSLANPNSMYKFSIPLTEVDQVVIKGESNYLSPILWGTGIGLATGIIAPIGLSAMAQETLDPDSEPEFEFSSELLVSGFVCAAIGAGIGYIIGLLSAEDDLPIRFVSDRSVLRLTDYAHYNFRNLEKLNQDYQEIK